VELALGGVVEPALGDAVDPALGGALGTGPGRCGCGWCVGSGRWLGFLGGARAGAGRPVDQTDGGS
jgi:hypothetical protein